MTQRPKQTNCRNEPAYPDHETVVMSMKNPNLTAHLPSKRCDVQCPHPIIYCGEFESMKTFTIITCKCGNIVQRLPVAAAFGHCTVANETLEQCEQCKPHVGQMVETSEQQFRRISEHLANEVTKLEQKHKADKHIVGMAVFGWLVQARVELENLKKRIERGE